MVVCPIALVASCRKCPAFSVCPLKGVIGDYKPETPPQAQAAAPATPSPRGKARSKRARTRRSRKR
jgi:hypothetical protein